MLRAVLIVAVALATSASADLWTAPPRGSAAPTQGLTAPPRRDQTTSVHQGGPRDGRHEPAFTLTVVADPTCPVSPAVVQDALAFAQAHRDIGVRILLANRPARSRHEMGPFVDATQAGVTVAWAPGAVRRLAPVALPALFLEDGQGHGARATGRPPLEALWQAVVRGSGS
jgi:hypothetical protein